MARKVRVEYPGAIHQVMNRGDRRGAILGMYGCKRSRCCR